MTKGNHWDREVIREYLLGHVDQDEVAEASMSEDILFDDELAEVVESVEDEIIEEYREGSLDADTRKSVEGYFLQPPERQEKLRFAQVLERHLAAKPAPLPQGRPTVRGELSREVRHSSEERVAWWRSPFWTYGPVAAMVVIGLVAASYVGLLKRKLIMLEHDLGQERAQAVSLAGRLSQLQPPIVVLSLVSARPRSASIGEEIPRLEIKPATEQIVVEVALEHAQTNGYAVRLEARGSEEPVWAAKLLPIVSANGDARLVFDLPAKALRSGAYSLQVSELAKNGTTKYYDFVSEAPK